MCSTLAADEVIAHDSAGGNATPRLYDVGSGCSHRAIDDIEPTDIDTAHNKSPFAVAHDRRIG